MATNSDWLSLYVPKTASGFEPQDIDIDEAFSEDNTPTVSSTSVDEMSDSMDTEMDELVKTMDAEMDSMLFHDIVRILELESTEEKQPKLALSSLAEIVTDNDRGDNGNRPYQLPIPMGAGWSIMGTPPHEDIRQDEIFAVSNTAKHDDSVDQSSELLRREIVYLEAQRDFLLLKAQQTPCAARIAAGGFTNETYRQRALEEKQKLEAATQLRQMMLEYIIQQERSNRDIGVLIKVLPLNHYRNSLVAPFESYIRLCKDPQERRATLLAIKADKLASVSQFIESQTRHMDPEREFFYLDTFEKFGKFYMADISISMIKHTTIKEVSRSIIRRFVMRRDLTSLLGSVMNREVFDAVNSEFLHARDVDRVDIAKNRLDEREFVIQESNMVFYSQPFNDIVVMMCDYINEDELHPYRVRGRIRRDLTIGIVLIPHVNSDGAKCVIMKMYSFVKYHLHAVSPTPELISAISMNWLLVRQSVQHCMTKAHNPSAKKMNVRIVRRAVPV